MSKLTQPNSQDPAAGREYIAFISYRHKPLDMEAARRIQKKIENYRIPKDLRQEGGSDRLGVVFRDEDELPASSSLTGSITYALDHTKYLLVICTPDLPKSKWCEEEIRYFLKTHDRDHVLAVLVDGEPEESFSPYLRYLYDDEGNITGEIEPLAANISGPDHRIDNKAFRKEIVRIYAALLGCPFDTLWQRDRRARTNRLIGLMGLATAVMAVFIGVVLNRNARISEQNIQIQRQLSTAYVDQGFTQLEGYDVKGALTSALDALLSGEDRSLYDRRAELLMGRALHAYQDTAPQSSLLYKQSTEIVNMAVSRDQTRVFLADKAGTVRAADIESGGLLWEEIPRPAESTMAADWELDYDRLYGNWAMEVFAPASADLVLCRNAGGVTALSADDGSPVWEWEPQVTDGCTFRALSPDGTRLLLLDKDAGYDEETVDPKLVVLDTSDGQVIAETEFGISVNEDGVMVPLSILLDSDTKPWYDWGCAFSGDGKTCVISAYAKVREEDDPDEEDGEISESDEEGVEIPDSDEEAGNDEEELSEESIYDSQDDPVTYDDYQDQEYLTFFVFDTADWSLKSQYTFREDSGINMILGMQMTDSGDIICARYVSGYGILVSRIDNARGEVRHGQTNVTLSSWSGILFDAEGEQRFVPALFGGGLVLVPLENVLHVYDAATLDYLRSFSLSADIIHAEWVDDERKTVEIITGDGTFVQYTFAEDGHWEAYDAVKYDGIALGLAGTLNGSPMTNEDGRLLAVSSADTSHLILLKNVRDPEGFSFENEDLGQAAGMQLTPSGERLVVFYDDYENVTAVRYDSETLEEIDRVTIDDYLWSLPTVMDEDHFIYDCTIYGFDGSCAYLETVTEDNAFLMTDSMSSVRMSDGRTLTVFNSTDEEYGLDLWSLWGEDPSVLEEEDHMALWPVWIDGKLIPKSQEADTGLTFGETNYYKAAPNGYILAHGMLPYTEDGQIFFKDDADFAAFNALEGKKTIIPDQDPGRDFIAAIENEGQHFICAYDDGSLYLYGMDDGSYEALDFGYSPGEIKAMAYSETDDYLVVYTQNARIDIWSMADRQRVFSESRLSQYGDYAPFVEGVLCQTDPEAHRLYVTVRLDEASLDGLWFGVDTDTWVVTAESGDMCYGVYSGRVMTSSDGNLIAYPMRPAEELAAWAAEAGK